MDQKLTYEYVSGRPHVTIIELPLLHCYRCGNSWTPRRVMVRMCPRCKSRYWDEPKIRTPTGGSGLGVHDVIDPFRQRILEIARKYGVREVWVFGSVARGEATPDSDVDLLVEFPKLGDRPSDRHHRMTIELRSLLGRRVEVVSRAALHWFIEPQIVAEAVPL